jgi:hypothetical protein
VSNVEFIWAKDLPPFDENASCPKCRSGVNVVFHDTHIKKFPCMDDFTWVLGEHLCRVCRSCKFGWCEAPDDVKPARNLRAGPDPETARRPR